MIKCKNIAELLVTSEKVAKTEPQPVFKCKNIAELLVTSERSVRSDGQTVKSKNVPDLVVTSEKAHVKSEGSGQPMIKCKNIADLVVTSEKVALPKVEEVGQLVVAKNVAQLVCDSAGNLVLCDTNVGRFITICNKVDVTDNVGLLSMPNTDTLKASDVCSKNDSIDGGPRPDNTVIENTRNPNEIIDQAKIESNENTYSTSVDGTANIETLDIHMDQSIDVGTNVSICDSDVSQNLDLDNINLTVTLQDKTDLAEQKSNNNETVAKDNDDNSEETMPLLVF
ncbi:unnamed protein product [Colias eurytheme]|nr:unnamed protein product [Colias eurytheme]